MNNINNYRFIAHFFVSFIYFLYLFFACLGFVVFVFQTWSAESDWIKKTLILVRYICIWIGFLSLLDVYYDNENNTMVWMFIQQAYGIKGARHVLYIDLRIPDWDFTWRFLNNGFQPTWTSPTDALYPVCVAMSSNILSAFSSRPASCPQKLFY